MAPPSKTAPSTPRLSEAARLLSYPADITSTAWPRVVGRCSEMGVSFDLWQHGVGTLALGKRKDGVYAATVGGVVLSIPRQVGKTFLVGMIVIALCTLFPGLTVLWTAHRTRTATKTFDTLKGYVKRKGIRPHLAAGPTMGIRNANGEQQIAFRNGSRIMFGAREDGFGRGFDEVDIEVFDEAQILTEKALEDMVAAANQSRQATKALLFFMGTPPRPDATTGEEFTNRRKKAQTGKAPNMVYVEFGADPDAGLDDHAQWRKANPSFPHRTPVESMERMRENLTDDDSFRREALGIWPEPKATNAVLTADVWKKCLDASADIIGQPILVLDASPELTTAGIVAAGRTADGRIALEVTSDGKVMDYHPGVEWLFDLPWSGRRVWLVEGSAAMALQDRLTTAGAFVDVMPRADYARACVNFVSGVTAASIVHRGQGPLTTAITAGAKRSVDEGLWVWGRNRSTSDIALLVAATAAAELVAADALRPFNVW